MSRTDCSELLDTACRCIVEERGGEYLSTEEQKRNIDAIAEALVSPNRRKWGLLLNGNPGCGKTTVVKAIQRLYNVLDLRDPVVWEENVKAGIVIVDARKIDEYYVEKREHFKEISGSSLLAIDDLGQEQKGRMVYGQIAFPVNELFEYRYERQLYTVITTNLRPAEIKKTYGGRFYDRIVEMMEPVTFGVKSYRQPGERKKGGG